MMELGLAMVVLAPASMVVVELLAIEYNDFS